jgi:hypothetical protein
LINNVMFLFEVFQAFSLSAPSAAFFPSYTDTYIHIYSPAVFRRKKTAFFIGRILMMVGVLQCIR